MRNIYRIALLGILLALIAGWQIGCDRMSGTLDTNQMPNVEFVNIPLDSSLFNYAPIVYWYGNDPDGLVEYFSWYDDTTQAALQAYDNDNLANYVVNIPDDAWVNTVATSQKIYLLTEAGDTTQHIFFIRCTDNENAKSEIKARSFFRSNEAPNHPTVSVLPVEDFFEGIDMIEDKGYQGTLVTTDAGYQDTLLMGNTLTQTYGGMQILWTGDDPDDRALSIIPLEFSYLIVDEFGEMVPFPGDTLRENGWSHWSGSKTKTLYGLETGTYTFYLLSRDDGLTECAEPAWVRFHCIKPTFQYRLLMVDENRPISGPADFGAVDPDTIMAFHRENLEQAWPLMQQWVYPDCTFAGFGVDIFEWRNRDLSQGKSIPYSLIEKFQLVWLVDDDRPNLGNWDGVLARQHVMADYLNVGGMIMITGRRIFCGSYMICGHPSNFGTNENEQFFRTYFNVSEAFGNSWQASEEDNIDFSGATGVALDVPDLEVDTVKVYDLRYGSRRYTSLPDIDWVGRNRETATLYYYRSSTADRPYDAYDVNCKVTDSTPYYCKILAQGYDRLLSVSRIYNKSRSDSLGYGVYGEFMYFADDNTAFIASTPAAAGAWGYDDTLEVDFTYIPISNNHLKPVSTRYENFQETLDYERYLWTGHVRYRTSLTSFPLYFIKNDELTSLNIPPVVHFLLIQFAYFYQQRTQTYYWGN